MEFKKLKDKLTTELLTRDASDQFIYSFVLSILKNRDAALEFMTSHHGGYTLTQARSIRCKYEYRTHHKLNTATNNRESI